eukprot:s1378_g12.t1
MSSPEVSLRLASLEDELPGPTSSSCTSPYVSWSTSLGSPPPLPLRRCSAVRSLLELAPMLERHLLGKEARASPLHACVRQITEECCEQQFGTPLVEILQSARDLQRRLQLLISAEGRDSEDKLPPIEVPNSWSHPRLTCRRLLLRDSQSLSGFDLCASGWSGLCSGPVYSDLSRLLTDVLFEAVKLPSFIEDLHMIYATTGHAGVAVPPVLLGEHLGITTGAAALILERVGQDPAEWTEEALGEIFREATQDDRPFAIADLASSSLPSQSLVSAVPAATLLALGSRKLHRRRAKNPKVQRRVIGPAVAAAAAAAKVAAAGKLAAAGGAAASVAAGIKTLSKERPAAHKSGRRPKMVVLGTGWGSVTFLQGLSEDIAKYYDITVVSPRNFFLTLGLDALLALCYSPSQAFGILGRLPGFKLPDFLHTSRLQPWLHFRARLSLRYTPLLPASTMGSIEERSIVTPIRRVTKDKADFLEAKCEHIDVKNKVVKCTRAGTPDNSADIDYDHFPEERTAGVEDVLIYGIGAQTNDFATPGVQEHAFFFKELTDARKVRDKVTDLFERASLPNATEKQKKRHRAVKQDTTVVVELRAACQHKEVSFTSAKQHGRDTSPVQSSIALKHGTNASEGQQQPLMVQGGIWGPE